MASTIRSPDRGARRPSTTPLVAPRSQLSGALSRSSRVVVYMHPLHVYTGVMGKRLVDIDDSVLEAAQAELGTSTIKATVNEALRRVGAGRADDVHDALDVLAAAAFPGRADAWR